MYACSLSVCVCVSIVSLKNWMNCCFFVMSYTFFIVASSFRLKDCKELVRQKPRWNLGLCSESIAVLRRIDCASIFHPTEFSFSVCRSTCHLICRNGLRTHTPYITVKENISIITYLFTYLLTYLLLVAASAPRLV